MDSFNTVLIAFHLNSWSEVSNPTRYLPLIRHAARRTRQHLVIWFEGKQLFQDHPVEWELCQRFLGIVYTAASQEFARQGRILVDVDVMVEGLCAAMGPCPGPLDLAILTNESLIRHPELPILHSTTVEQQPLPPVPVVMTTADPRTKQTINSGQDKFDVVALGGTFDHLHSGHKILLSMAAYLTSRKLIVGITGDAMLKSKAYAEYLEPFDTRVERVRRFLELINPLIELDLVLLNDVYGPTGSSPDIHALVLSKESIGGGEMVARVREERNLPALKPFVIDVITSADVDPTSEQSEGGSALSLSLADENSVDRLKELKIGSTYIRRMLAEYQAKGV